MKISGAEVHLIYLSIYGHIIIYFKNALKEIRCLAWGDFKTVVEKIKKYDKDFINISNFSDSTKWEIINILINKNKK